MKKLVLVGEFNSPNMGDSVIFHVFLALLRKEYPQKIITIDISDYRNPTHLFTRVINKACHYLGDLWKFVTYPYMRIKTSLRIPTNSYICFVGGALCQNYFANSISAILRTGKVKNCFIDFFSIGIGPSSPQNEKKILSAISSCNKIKLTIRDGWNYWNSKHFTYQIQSDIAICSSLIYKGNEKKEKILGIGVISLQSYKLKYPNNTLTIMQYQQSLKELIQDAISMGYKVELFCNGDIPDYDQMLQIKEYLNNNDVSIARRPQNHLELVDLINRYSFIIASRLHAIIISYSFHIPFFAIGWDPKVDDFLTRIQRNDLGKPLNCIPSIDWNDVLQKQNLRSEDFLLLKKQQNTLIQRIKTIVSNIS
ncbi:MAG: polysaccharide pyruvyl transferase family protein [Fibrobacter sp.]|nr:polysaccharide pyruvyl transferase family protein [Fibrobacter sp.]